MSKNFFRTPEGQNAAMTGRQRDRDEKQQPDPHNALGDNEDDYTLTKFPSYLSGPTKHFFVTWKKGPNAGRTTCRDCGKSLAWFQFCSGEADRLIRQQRKLNARLKEINGEQPQFDDPIPSNQPVNNAASPTGSQPRNDVTIELTQKQ